MDEERGKEEVIKLIQGASSLVSIAASESTKISESNDVSFDLSKILLSQSSEA